MVLRRVKAGKCTNVGNDIKAEGQSPRSQRRRSQGGWCLRAASTDYRPVKTTERVVLTPRAAAARRKRLAAKRRGPARSAARNGSAMVRGTKALGGRIAQWQGPGSPGINTTGSYFFGGHAVPRESAEKALRELKSYLPIDRSAVDRRHLEVTIRQLSNALKR